MDKHYTFFDDDGRSFFVNKNITSKELENLRLKKNKKIFNNTILILI